MKKTFTTLHQVYTLLLEDQNHRVFLAGEEMLVILMRVGKEGGLGAQLQFVIELTERYPHPDEKKDSETWETSFGSAMVAIETDRKCLEATVTIIPLNQRQSPLIFKIERKSLPRKFR